MRTFGEDVLVEFLQLNGLELMIRGHSVLEDGYRWWFGGKLLSLFSVFEGGGAVAVVEDNQIIIYKL